MDELKPCPFCGGRALLNTNVSYTPNGTPYSFIKCNKCNITFGLYHTHDADKITAAWNERVATREATPREKEEHDTLMKRHSEQVEVIRQRIDNGGLSQTEKALLRDLFFETNYDRRTTR